MAVAVQLQAPPTPQPQAGPGSVSGQGAVGHPIAAPWWDGTYEVTQGWGPTDFDLEPPEDRNGQHYAHWHAGVDIGVPCGTHIHLPAEITQATVRLVDNPGGYGTALVVQLTDYDIWFGHLAQRLVMGGVAVRGGADLAVSNNTGNSTGCHVHFEVRPKDGKYGTDVDPTAFLTSGRDITKTGLPSLPNPLDALGQAVQQAEQRAEAFVVGTGQVVLGSTMVLTGLLMTAFVLRGGAPAGLPAAARARLRPKARSIRPGPSIITRGVGVLRRRPSTPAPSTAAIDRPRLRY